MSRLLEIHNLTTSAMGGTEFTLRRTRTNVLQGLSVSIDSGITMALLGSSGSGKSTLARCIAGLQRPDSGEIVFDGVNVFPQVAHRRRFALQIQMLFQASGASLDPMMTVRSSMQEALQARQRAYKDQSGSAETWVGAVGLKATVLERLPSQLSGGQRQRVALARALAVRPRLLILDEPTSALDMITQEQILGLVKELQASFRLTILFITHDVGVALATCDRIAVLHEGIIVEEQPRTGILQHQRHQVTQRLFSACGF